QLLRQRFPELHAGPGLHFGEPVLRVLRKMPESAAAQAALPGPDKKNRHGSNSRRPFDISRFSAMALSGLCSLKSASLNTFGAALKGAAPFLSPAKENAPPRAGRFRFGWPARSGGGLFLVGGETAVEGFAFR